MVYNYLRKAMTGILLLCPSFLIHAQDVVIRQVELKDGNVVLHYDLVDENQDRKYTLRLYSSKDNFVQPLTLVTGDIGIGVPVGGNKQVTWNAREELDSAFSGNISLELKGQVYIPFITLSGFEDYGTFKRGKAYDLTWSGGRGDNVLNFDLYHGDEKVWTQPNVANSGNLTLVIPTDVKPGRKYIFRISDAKNPDEVIYTVEFNVKRKVPQVVRIATMAAIVGGAAILINSFGGAGTPEEPKIGEPPLPKR
jgi:hypothetical protein